MRPIVSSYTTGIKSYPLVSSLALISPVCSSVPESVPCAPSPQLFYWDNAPVETRSLATTRPPRPIVAAKILRIRTTRDKDCSVSAKLGRICKKLTSKEESLLSIFCFCCDRVPPNICAENKAKQIQTIFWEPPMFFA